MHLPSAAKGTASSRNAGGAGRWAAPGAPRGAEGVLCPLASGEIQLVGAEWLIRKVCSGDEGFRQALKTARSSSGSFLKPTWLIFLLPTVFGLFWKCVVLELQQESSQTFFWAGWGYFSIHLYKQEKIPIC